MLPSLGWRGKNSAAEFFRRLFHGAQVLDDLATMPPWRFVLVQQMIELARMGRQLNAWSRALHRARRNETPADKYIDAPSLRHQRSLTSARPRVLARRIDPLSDLVVH